MNWRYLAASGLAVVCTELSNAREPPPLMHVASVAPPGTALREQEIITDVPAPPPPVTKSPPPPKNDVEERPNGNRKVLTSDDNVVPEWCRCLTVVESSDMAENLGLLPMGSAKKSATKIAIGPLLEKEREEEAKRRAAEPKPAQTVWTFIPGETFVDAR